MASNCGNKQASLAELCCHQHCMWFEVSIAGQVQQHDVCGAELWLTLQAAGVHPFSLLLRSMPGFQ